MRKESFIVDTNDGGKRLDQTLAKRISGLSRRQARVLVDIGGVFVDGTRVKVASRPLRPGQRIEVHVGGAFERATKAVGQSARTRDAAALPSFRIVHEDDDVIVVDKPPGLLTAPTPESDRNNLADMLTRRAGLRILVVHRIDLHTSGLLVFAKTRIANQVLSEQFRRHDVERAYLAVVGGVFPADIRSLAAPIRGRHALTHFEIERVLGTATILRCRLETGRTHQIRIHCRDLGHPVLGDQLYGQKAPATGPHPPRLALHAAELGFKHPRRSERLHFNSPWPPDLAGWLAHLASDGPA